MNFFIFVTRGQSNFLGTSQMCILFPVMQDPFFIAQCDKEFNGEVNCLRKWSYIPVIRETTAFLTVSLCVVGQT